MGLPGDGGLNHHDLLRPGRNAGGGEVASIEGQGLGFRWGRCNVSWRFRRGPDNIAGVPAQSRWLS
jgi:hypothetical protein